MAVCGWVGQSFAGGVFFVRFLTRAFRRSSARGPALLAGFVLLALSAMAAPAHALTCPDQTGGSLTTPMDVTYFLTANGCTKFDPGESALVFMTAQVQDGFATVTFLRPGTTDPTVSTSITGPGCTVNGGTTAANVAGYKLGNLVSCKTTARLTNGAEFSFLAAYDASGFVSSLTGVSFSVPATTTTVRSTPNPSSFEQAVTVTATVVGGVGAPAGVVDFKDGATMLGSGVLADTGSGLSVVSIASGSNSGHACAITTAGGVRCWGANAENQLGDGTSVQSSIPVDVFGLTSGVVAISAGDSHSCALTSAGGVKCWGSNAAGRLGDNTGNGATSPVDVFGLTSGVAAIAVGAAHSCALTSAGGVKCWGFNGSGQLGNNTVASALAPVDVSGLSTGVRAIAAGANHTCAMTTAGVQCWGNNATGQLGDGTTDNRLVPTTIPFFANTALNVAISAGAGHSCALLTTAGGTPFCWGANGAGQLGADPALISQKLFPDNSNNQFPSGGVSAMSAGADHTCFLLASGAARCLGGNGSGQLGNDTTESDFLAVDVASLGTGVKAIVAGNGSTYAVTTGLGAKAWGSNQFERLGDGTDTNRSLAVDISELSAGRATASLSTSTLPVGNRSLTGAYGGDFIRTGSNSTAVSQTVTKAANIITFPALANRAFGDAAPVPAATASSGLAVSYASTTAPVCTVTSGGVITLVSVGTCSITASQAGNANFLAAAPVARSFSVTKVANTITFPVLANAVFGAAPPVPAATASSGLAVTYASTTAAVCTSTSTGAISLVSVGTCSITASQAGNANFVAATPVVRSFSVTKGVTTTTVDSSVNPSRVGQPVSFTARVAAAAGLPPPTGAVTITDTTTGAVLGTPALTAVTQTRLSAGNEHACSVGSDGGVSCWGLNANGQLGDGTTTDRLTPVPVSGLSSGVAAVAAGSRHSCALTTAGAVKCWGQNGSSGALGDGTTIDRLTPVAVTGLSSGVKAIAAGAEHSCALKTSGAVVCWGLNNRGQIGDGTSGNNRLTPVPVSGLSSGVAAISIGFEFSCALRTAGAVLCWGSNSNGRLGDGTNAFDRLTPTPVVGLSAGVAAISTSQNAHSCAVTTAGAVRCWGFNGAGQLGDGTTIDRLTSVAVPSLSSGVASVAAGGSHSCAVTTTGAARCWGNNFAGRLGDGTTTDRLVPTQVVGLSSGVAAIALHSGAQGCALTTAGAVRCWGLNDNGELGDGTTTQRLTPVATRHPVTSVASVATSGLAAGAHAIRASYAGNTLFLASTSALLTQTVNKGATVTALATSASSVAFGASVTLTATVGVVAPASATPSGSVTFFRAGNISIGTAAVSAGKAVLSTTALPSGANAITARYDVAGADPRLLTSTSAAVSVSVAKRTSTTTLTASKNPAALGTAVTLTATVGTGATGNVVFKNGTATIATVALTNGVATTAFTPSVAGTLPITAAYAGDANFNASTSAALKLIAFASCKDGFAAALPVAGANASVFGTTVGATGETGEPNHAGNSGALNSVWCTWTAPATGTVTIDTTGSGFNTTLGVYTGTSVAGLSQVAANDNIGPGNSQSRVSFAATAGTVYRIAIDGVSATGAYVLNIALAPPAPVTFASVLPTARSIATGATATAFATMINTGAVAATACSLALPPGFPANFSYQITNATNALTGTPDTPVNIAAGAAQGFFLAVTPLVDLNSTELAIVFDCTNTPTTITVPGLNTLLLSASSTPSPDLISIGSTPSGDGIASIPGATGSTAFGAATVNIGAAGTITASVDDNGRGLALTALLCVTNPTTGACTNPATPAASATFALAANASATVAVFVTGTGNVPFDPGANRLFLRFKTADGVTRGATSVAVRTQ
jgi:alpha-tubulin suppressor-like RCC1 family protein